MTGFIFAALRAGINPAIIVIVILNPIKVIVDTNEGKALISFVFVIKYIILLIGIVKIYDISMPNIPEAVPMIKDSALKILDILCLDAPTALNIPISLVLSITEILMIIPIIIKDTIRETATKEINI